jgi:hypothetical protein
MDSTGGLQFFVLDLSVVILGIIVLFLCAAVYWMYRRYSEQKRLYTAMQKTVDRILKIEAGAGGGIDGWEMAHREKLAAKRTKTKSK